MIFLIYSHSFTVCPLAADLMKLLVEWGGKGGDGAAAVIDRNTYLHLPLIMIR